MRHQKLIPIYRSIQIIRHSQRTTLARNSLCCECLTRDRVRLQLTQATKGQQYKATHCQAHMSSSGSEEQDNASPRRAAALIVVDMSVEQMANVNYRAKEITTQCHHLLHSNVFALKIDCRLWLNRPEESTLSWVYPETAQTLFVAGSSGADLIPELKKDLPAEVVFCPKNNYSCFVKSTLRTLLQQNDITHVYLCGINTDYCIFATALDAFGLGFRTFVVHDAVSSIRGEPAHEEGLANLERHFGPTVLVSTQEVLLHSTSSCH